MEEDVNSPLVEVELDSQAISLYICVVGWKHGRYGVEGYILLFKKEKLTYCLAIRDREN